MEIKKLSWSELALWNRSRDEWRKRYIEGEKEPSTYAMKRGTDIHRMLLQNGLWRLGKREQNYTPDEIRTHGKIEYAFCQLGLNLNANTEIEVTAEIEGIPTIGFWDAFVDGLLVEVKSGKAVWKELEAKNSGQLAFYSLQGEAIGKHIEECLLFSCSTTNGKATAYRFKLDESLVNDVRNNILEAKHWMDENNLWSKRMSRKLLTGK
jgi:hypothetical protein